MVPDLLVIELAGPTEKALGAGWKECKGSRLYITLIY